MFAYEIIIGRFAMPTRPRPALAIPKLNEFHQSAVEKLLNLYLVGRKRRVEGTHSRCPIPTSRGAVTAAHVVLVV